MDPTVTWVGVGSALILEKNNFDNFIGDKFSLVEAF